ncbi:hypothetical protein [Goodfellowiella coeruleoviolacea]|uniref:Uncharacterized protein n=1 Tax=Goodfellowiella coeruleoviolacea TaxID=334858 RepID=A0AAE3KF39_9PSEU|nr:hypothetical protein [Goodfellowiella coeruleoviolacea]MCP2165981.1 hypothetical protein [Goodfellowiella coeruleoviolacea]
MSEQPARPPAIVRVTVGVWLALAVFGLVNVGYLWLLRDRVRQLVASSAIVPADQVDQVTQGLLLTNTAIAVLFGGAYAGFALLLHRRRRWARIALTVVGALHLLLVLTNGLSVQNLLVVLLIAAGVACAWSRGVAAWTAPDTTVARPSGTARGRA